MENGIQMNSTKSPIQKNDEAIDVSASHQPPNVGNFYSYCIRHQKRKLMYITAATSISFPLFGKEEETVITYRLWHFTIFACVACISLLGLIGYSGYIFATYIAKRYSIQTNLLWFPICIALILQSTSSVIGMWAVGKKRQQLFSDEHFDRYTLLVMQQKWKVAAYAAAFLILYFTFVSVYIAPIDFYFGVAILLLGLIVSSVQLAAILADTNIIYETVGSILKDLLAGNLTVDQFWEKKDYLDSCQFYSPYLTGQLFFIAGCNIVLAILVLFTPVGVFQERLIVVIVLFSREIVSLAIAIPFVIQANEKCETLCIASCGKGNPSTIEEINLRFVVRENPIHIDILGFGKVDRSAIFLRISGLVLAVIAAILREYVNDNLS